ncbi:hypothetical protein [Variovorax sp.]|uniref:hypothetical protein n=1 Tax=Variovorax sp. TaxID=1871043 RepID=UPI002D420965|nr:hypothetical protein [Variovorax sp.]HYP84099.1 hypothetical protein [Variovorax sp.]
MHIDGDMRQGAQYVSGNAPRDDQRVEWWSRAVVGAIVGVSMLALALSATDLTRALFPLTGLLVFTIGMGFGVIPLLLYHEYLLKERASHATRARLMS